ncbi:translation Initiation Factor Eif4e [Diplocarpon rosae]|nr:translation Initiation Factor Eif4e [Diplocarpon rosae]
MAAVAPQTPIDASTPVDLTTIPISPEGGSNENKKPGPSGEDEQITVFHDKDNFNGDNWNDLLKEVITFNSVEEFWGVYNNIAPVSELALKSDYHLFKENVRPEWEDPQNKHGGKWSYQFKEKRNVPIDDLWLHVMLSAIGETLEDEDDGELMGVVVNVRKGFYRLGVWTRTIGKSIPGGGDGDVAGGKGRSTEKGKEILMNIGRRFKDVLKVPASEAVEFSGHTDSAHSGSTRAKSKYSV